MGLLYPDHPDDHRPGLFENHGRAPNKRTYRSSDRRSTQYRKDRPARVYDDVPINTSTTSSGLKSLNDLLVRPPTSRRESETRRRERDDLCESQTQERRERRQRRERATPERTPSPAPERSSPRRMEMQEPRQYSPSPRRVDQPSSPSRNEHRGVEPRRVRGPRPAERPRYERTSTSESDRRRESSSPRKRRPSYAGTRRGSGYDDRGRFDSEPEPQRRGGSRAPYNSRAESDVDPVPVPPPFRKISFNGALGSGVAGAEDMTRAAPAPEDSRDPANRQWKAPLETILSESHSQHDVETSRATLDAHQQPVHAAGNDQQKPKFEREESFVSSYLEGSSLERGVPPRAYRPVSSVDSYSDSEYYSHRHSRRPRDSAWDEVEYYKYGQAPEYEPLRRRRCCMCWDDWSLKRKRIVIFGTIASIILLIILIAVAASAGKGKHDYKASDAKVTNPAAFDLGGATRNDPNDVEDSTATPVDQYVYYQGDASNFPDSSKWISFKDMWNANLNTLQHSCEWLDEGKNNSPEMIQQIFDAIQDRASASLVDHRYIFATILQESNGCPRVGDTESSGGVRNPGLMQSHNGHTYDPKHSKLSMMQMVQDGTQGTKHGDGIVQNLNLYGNPYKAMRGYNSGYIPDSGNLSEKSGATKCYVSDMANRLTGWVAAASTCYED